MTRVLLICLFVFGFLLVTFRFNEAAELPAISGLALEKPVSIASERKDWLIDNTPFVAGVFRTQNDHEIVLTNGIVRRTFRLHPNAATVAIENLVTGNNILRAVKPEARVTINGQAMNVGGLVGQPNKAYLPPAWIDQMTAEPGAMQVVGFEVGKPAARFAWKRARWHAPHADWPPKGVSLRFDYAPANEPTVDKLAVDEPTIDKLADNTESEVPDVQVSVHYELYDGVPVMCKWITVRNRSDRVVTVDRFTGEELAVVEHSNWVETRAGVDLPKPDSLHVETDFSFGGFEFENANRHMVHWRPDPDYTTQVNYLLQQPCLLVVEPTYGPAQDVAPNESFESCRTFELLHDSTERERRGFALRRMYRTIAPWVTENPLMHHMVNAKPNLVRQAIDQAADVGFEMVIMSFGSGFHMENENDEYLKQWTDVAAYAKSKGVEIGSYSLLSSRRIGGGNDIVSPDGQQPTHGNCPALTSEWGRDYFRKLYSFYEQTGFTLLEHDGSYPGDVDVTARPPLQKGEADSRWVQWRIISDFYKWCRGNGVYINVPDYYFLAGANKCGMGYREVNWSLPRDMQVIHTRQNIFDGTWTKTPSMGWMFVPLSQYHGGGAAATIEPLDQHLDHYRQMIESNLSAGVQACYRGPRLYDTDRTRAMVKQQVDWFKAHRGILESDVVHGRRADGRDVDWLLHVNPQLDECGMLLAYNPLDRPVERTLSVNLYYTGLQDTATIRDATGIVRSITLARDYRANIDVEVPAKGMSWYVILDE